MLNVVSRVRPGTSGRAASSRQCSTRCGVVMPRAFLRFVQTAVGMAKALSYLVHGGLRAV